MAVPHLLANVLFNSPTVVLLCTQSAATCSQSLFVAIRSVPHALVLFCQGVPIQETPALTLLI